MPMKIAAFAMAILVTLFAQAQDGDRQWLFIKFAERDPYRKVDGELFDLNPRFRWADPSNNAGSFPKPSPEWKFLGGKVLQLADDGILLRKYHDFKLSGDYDLVYVKNFPMTIRVVDDSPVAIYAMPSGRHQYTSTIGATKTVEAYDYGTIPTSQEISNLVKIADLKRSTADAALSIRISEANAAAALKRVEQRAAELKHHQRLADKGDAYGQLRMGERYLKGDGVEEDQAKAIDYLNKAASQGNETAKAMLQKIASSANKQSSPTAARSQ